MTREEAINILKGAIKSPNTKDGYMGQALSMAIKALEQENVSNKIWEKIFWERHKCGFKGQYNAGMVEAFDIALDIIDKYRGDEHRKP